MNTHIQRAINAIGTAEELAALLCVTPAFVSLMKTGDRDVPARLCLPIERVTDKHVTAKELRPDLFGSAEQ